VQRVFSAGDLVPRYGVLDGTWIVTVLLPLYFGVAVGDLGLGAVMLALALGVGAALRSRPKARLATAVLSRAAGAAIVFGVLYGEFFDQPFRADPLNRVETVSTFGTVAVAFLVAQLVMNVATGVLWSVGPRKRGDAWAVAGEFALFGAATLFGIAVGWLIGSVEVALLERLASDAFPDVGVMVVFYMVYAVVVATAAVSADVALSRIRGSRSDPT